jgi:hypothetical protein
VQKKSPNDASRVICAFGEIFFLSSVFFIQSNYLFRSYILSNTTLWLRICGKGADDQKKAQPKRLVSSVGCYFSTINILFVFKY